ncbi:hypothetical protein EG329_007875 [Mollisiaceae sp. DMI_Dod_QoI]|nr:hypothetical protein EG329_007875 [Helotiales sp. DMI_Dod_QoI]
MARESRPRQPEGKATVVEPPVQRHSTRISGATSKVYRYVSKHVNCPSPQRPVRDDSATKEVQKSPKTRQTVSITGVFKKTQKQKSARVSRKQQKHGINEARTHLSTHAKATFTSLHNEFNSKLQAIHDEDTSFLQHVSETAAALSTPLLGDKLETEIRRDGKRVVETVEIGKRVEGFKVLIEKEEAKLKQAWKEWDEVQEEYIELGINVFGAEVFGRGEEARGGYENEMELLELEHNTRVEELKEEISEIGDETIQQMIISEKELDSATRKEQARLLQTLL